MPSLWSANGDEPASTALGWASLAARSVTALSMLPLAALQPEPGHHDSCEQERDHRGRDCRALAEHAAEDGALIRERRHQVGCIDRPAARHGPDQLEIGEGEEDRKRH